MSEDQYRQLAAEQGHCCAICRQPETAPDPKAGSIKRLAVDHCHTTGRVRGLLCFRCNSTIGRLREDIALVDAVREYLIFHARDDAKAA